MDKAKLYLQIKNCSKNYTLLIVSFMKSQFFMHTIVRAMREGIDEAIKELDNLDETK